MIYTDRSRYECGHRCPRERFWRYHYAPASDLIEREEIVQIVPGTVPLGDSLDLLFGKAIHELVETSQTRQLKTTAREELSRFQSDVTTPDGVPASVEYAHLFRGLSQAFLDFTFPILERDFEFIDAEREHTMDLGYDVQWMARRDADLRRKSDGLWFTLEVKTSAYPEQLMLEASTNFQLLMEVESMRRQYGLSPEECGGALLLVFDKGRKQRASEAERRRGHDGHRLLSPFTYWYGKSAASGESQYRLDYKQGWDRVPVWSIPGYFGTLFSDFSEEIQNKVQLFPSVSFDPQRVESIIRQVVAVERRLQEYPKKHIDEVFEQDFRMCNNSGGFKKTCPYKACCFSPSVASNPYVNGLQPRIPNHPQETGEQQ